MSDLAAGAQPRIEHRQYQLAQADQGRPQQFSIPAGDLQSALLAFSQQVDLQLLYPAELTAGLRTPGVQGIFTPREALARLLAGTDLVYEFTAAQTVSIAKATDGTGATVLGPIAVEGVGASLDPGRTEGTQSYAGSQVTVGAKTPTTIREIPQSVSVITRQRIEDRNFDTVEDAVNHTTGMRRQVVEQERAYLYSRGYVATTQVDGLTLDGGSGIFPNAFDLGVYDRVEVLRGPAGLFQGSGEPTGVVNLVRKRPTSQFAYGGAARIGSWDFYRGEADVSGPLFGSDKVRGRLVAVAQDRDFFVDEANETKKAGYGIVEMDVAETTTLTVGGALQGQDARPSFGLPAYADGTLLDVPRSTFIGADWNRQDFVGYHTFGEVQHRFDTGAVAEVSGQWLDRSQDLKFARSSSAVNPATGQTNLLGIAQDAQLVNINLDGHISSPIGLFGREHKIVAGLDYRNYDEKNLVGSAAVGTTNVFEPTINIADPNIPYSSQTRTEQEQYGLYGQARIKLFEPVTAIFGGRLSWWNSKVTNLISNQVTSETSIDGKFTPYAGVIFDISETVSLYAAYSEIFQPQAAITSSGSTLPPRTGSQYEVGIKTELLDKKLIGHLAAFRILDKNRATDDPSNPGLGFSVATGEVESRGVEAELSGKPYPGWDVIAGYAFTQTEYIKDNFGSAGTVFDTVTPKHSFNMWTKYTFDGGPLDGFSIGAGAKAISSIYRRSGASELRQEGYVLVDAQVGYHVTDTVGATLSVNNVFDEKYYERVGFTGFLNFYGAPRSVWLTIRKSF